ncbi:hypothetical protein QTP88_004201 [Uroleucon formosanum]
MVDENPTVVSPDIENAASNADPSHDLTAQMNTLMNTPSPISISGTKKFTNRKNIDTPSLFQQKLLKVLDKSQNEGEDDDKYFLLSLLPTMKAIDEASKMDARIELMQVIQKYTRKRPTESTSPYYLLLQPQTIIRYPSSIPALNAACDYNLQAPEIPSFSNNWAQY